jgi:multicomponent Na+:H+ antiporter subunit F
MNLSEIQILPLASSLALSILTVAMLLAFSRLYRGPSLPDRVVALDLIVMLTVGIVTVYDITTSNAIFLDVAIVLALLSFLGTVAFARYIEKGGAR